VAADLNASGKPVVLLCAGRGGCFSLDDALCAGSLIRAMQGGRKVRTELNDGGLAAAALERRYRAHLAAVMKRTSAARQIIEAGHESDIAYCLTRDRHDVVPVMSDRQIIRAV
jgi:2-phosphosulfolactate phosphatase